MAKFWDATSLKYLGFWLAVVAEALATFLLTFMICASYLPWYADTAPVLKILQVAFTAGFTYAVIIYAFDNASGAHINPSTTIAMLFSGKIGIFQSILYVGSQCGGAIGGAALILAITPESKRGGLGATTPASELTEAQAFGMEFMLTFVLVFTVFATTDGKRNITGSQPLAIGLCVLIDHLIGVSYTGASMNPARTLGPAVIMGNYQSFWVYWAGPLSAGVIAGWLYVFTFGRQLKTSKSPSSKKYEKGQRPHTLIVRDFDVENGTSNPAYTQESVTQTPTTMNDESYTTPL